MRFHRRVWYRALSLCKACIRASSSSSIATFVLNFVSFAASIAELAHGEETHTHSITHSPSLFDAREPKLCFGIIKFIQVAPVCNFVAELHSESHNLHILTAR